MSNVTGVITKKSQRQVTTKFGEKTSYSIQINGEWYSAGFKPCPYNEGDTVSANFEMNGSYKNITGYGAAPASAGSGAAPAPSAPAPRATGKQFPVPSDHPDRAIIRQNALAHATKLVVEGTSADMPDLDGAAERIIELAYKFEAYATGQREVEAAERLVDTGEAF